MKVKGPLFIGSVSIGNSDLVVDLSISTADLIAELEKRRPCEKCFFCECEYCVWRVSKLENHFRDGK